MEVKEVTFTPMEFLVNISIMYVENITNVVIVRSSQQIVKIVEVGSVKLDYERS